jgi:hypothetical protein
MGIEKNAWDLETVTASDYTLEIQISHAQVVEMRKRIYNESFAYGEKSEGFKLKLWVIKRIEDTLNELSGGQGGKVGSVDFTFWNSWVLDGLRARGDCIKNHQWKEFNEINRNLNEQMALEQQKFYDNYYATDDAKQPTICDPISAFVTMETEDAYNNLSGAKTIKFGGVDTDVEEALEPTTILW